MQAGDHVDVYAQVTGKIGLVMSNVLVLATPTAAVVGSTAPVSGNYILRVPTTKAPRAAPDRATESPGVSAMAKPRRTTFPVMLAVKT